MCAHQPLVVSRSPAARFLTGRPSSPSAVDVAFQLLEPAVRKALQETADPLILVISLGQPTQQVTQMAGYRHPA
jgi:hypothetical protein